MVDVGAKQHTKRVAVARTGVAFSNPRTLQMIIDDTNKKGDVLGTARVAGIMAAKKTSEIIPLCHPIALSRVDLVLTVRDSSGGRDGWVYIQAHVECTGPTGVEMEALTAATAAALTVYDMCKAVDREMRILPAEVVYKSGGQSGTHVSDGWMSLPVGQDWAAEWAPEWSVSEQDVSSALQMAKGHFLEKTDSWRQKWATQRVLELRRKKQARLELSSATSAGVAPGQ
jgi:molybdenum cofactor biosynthesis protein MoaC